MALLRAITALLLVCAARLEAQAAKASEAQVKAVFLFNFAQFVDWPPEAVPDSQAPLVIGILGGDPFGDFLDATVRGERRGARPFVVQRYQRVEDITRCDILFINRSAGAQPEEILARLKNRPILTVSDADRFAERGGMIRFVTDRSRIRLQINPEAAEAAHLTISSKLLRVAEVITPTGR
ncbi:MAG TPA: YfiR family protein [Gemmatimonadales bacterium]|nr:YfiR family protein [Gemmatimonadales bacterium]